MHGIYQVLEELNVSYKKYDHPAVFTCEQAEKICNDFKSIGIKNLFLRNKKGKNFFLVVACSSRKIDLKRLAEILGEKRLSFASKEDLGEILKLSPGSVSPFGLINDKDRMVKVIIDEDLKKCDVLHFHPNENTATLEIKTEDFIKFLDSTGNEVVTWK